MLFPRLLAVDPGLRRLGWAASTSVPSRAACGVFTLSGTADLGKLYAEIRDVMERLIVEHQPDIVRFVPAFGRSPQTDGVTAEGLAGVQAIMKLACFDHGLPAPLEKDERAMRKLVLGRGDFGRRDEFNRIIKGSGRKDAKETAMNWANQQGYDIGNEADIADALVVWHYDRMIRRADDDARVRRML